MHVDEAQLSKINSIKNQTDADNNASEHCIFHTHCQPTKIIAVSHSPYIYKVNRYIDRRPISRYWRPKPTLFFFTMSAKPSDHVSTRYSYKTDRRKTLYNINPEIIGRGFKSFSKYILRFSYEKFRTHVIRGLTTIKIWIYLVLE